MWLPAYACDAVCIQSVHSLTGCRVIGRKQGAERAERDRKAAEEKERNAARQREQEEKEARIKREMAFKRVDPATVMLSRRANHVVACTFVKSQFAGGALVPGYHEATCQVYKRMHWKQFDQKTKDWIFEYRHYGLLVWRLSLLPGSDSLTSKPNESSTRARKSWRALNTCTQDTRTCSH